MGVDRLKGAPQVEPHPGTDNKQIINTGFSPFTWFRAQKSFNEVVLGPKCESTYFQVQNSYGFQPIYIV